VAQLRHFGCTVRGYRILRGKASQTVKARL